MTDILIFSGVEIVFILVIYITFALYLHNDHKDN